MRKSCAQGVKMLCAQAFVAHILCATRALARIAARVQMAVVPTLSRLVTQTSSQGKTLILPLLLSRLSPLSTVPIITITI